MKKRNVIISMFFCFVLTNIGCGNKTSDSDNGSDSAKVDSVGKNKPCIRKDSVIQPQTATLLFDISGSMCGYLNSSDSRFIGVASFFENIPNNINIRLYGKEEGSPIDITEFDRMLNNRKIAWSNESNLKAMVESMINHVSNSDDVCFLLTDGILSGSDNDIKSSPDGSYNIRMRQKMSEDLAAMLRKEKGNLSALIVRYKAKFNGKYNCYNNDGRKLVNKDRPFFVIILGKWECVKYIEEKLNEVQTTNSTSTHYADIVMIGDANSYKKMKLSPAEGINPKNGNMVIKKDFKSRDIVLSADLGFLPDYMQTEDYMNRNLELFIQRGQSTQKVLNKEYYENSVKIEGEKIILKLSIRASQLKRAKLTCKLKYALPEWIEKKTDDNDLNIATNPLKQDQTFNLKYFIAGFAALQNDKYINEQILEFK